MIGNDRVRFCEHCQLSVHNLDLASRKQVRRLIARSGDRLCVSYSEPVPRVPTVPILHKIGRRTSALAAGAVTATLGISSAVAAASTPKPSTLRHEGASVTRVLDRFASSGGGTLKGIVYDPNDALITGASVTITNAETNDQQNTVTGGDGQYTFSELNPGKYHLKIQSPGFEVSDVLFITVRTGGETALMIAAKNGHVNNVHALILAGADVNIRDKEGKSALMYANENNEAAVARLLKAHGAIEFEVQEKQ